MTRDERVGGVLPPEIKKRVEDQAKAVDKGEEQARYMLPLLGEAGLLGAPRPTIAAAIDELAAADLSAAFTTWAQRIVIEVLRFGADSADKGRLEALTTGRRPGITGMAPVLQAATGAGDVTLTATESGSGYRINGKLNWASNLYNDSVLVSGARREDGEVVIFVADADSSGLELGSPFGILGLNATSSAWVTFDDVDVPASDVVAVGLKDFAAFLRPVLALLQVSECLGLAAAAARSATSLQHGTGVVFAPDIARAAESIHLHRARQRELLDALERGDAPEPLDVLQLRLGAAEDAVGATALEVRVAGGAGYARSSPTSRRFREATFLPVQSPSEGQLRWELAQLTRPDAG